MPVSRFTGLAGIPERTYLRRLARLRAGDLVKGPCAAPRVEGALACLNAAVARASELVELDDLRADRGTVDLFDDDGTYLRTVPAPIALVSDNGPCYRGRVFKTAFEGDDPLLRHVRTRVKS